MRTGLFGGTFSPPHKGHRRAAELFVKRARLDRLIVMPAGTPPHKEADPGASAFDRIEMARLAFGDIAGAQISDYELNKAGKSYTVETLRLLSELYPQDEIFMLVGEDMFLSLGTWRSPHEICSLATVAYMRRRDGDGTALESAAREYKKQWDARLLYIGDAPEEVSSTEIRQQLATGGADTMLCPEVYNYIVKNGLYGYGK